MSRLCCNKFKLHMYAALKVRLVCDIKVCFSTHPTHEMLTPYLWQGPNQNLGVYNEQCLNEVRLWKPLSRLDRNLNFLATAIPNIFFLNYCFILLLFKLLYFQDSLAENDFIFSWIWSLNSYFTVIPISPTYIRPRKDFMKGEMKRNNHVSKDFLKDILNFRIQGIYYHQYLTVRWQNLEI